MGIVGRYQNGNYEVRIYENGTKVRENSLDFFEPAFAENCDINITSRCDGACEFCYAGCTLDGQHGDILNYKFLDTLHEYTELAINGNDLSHPDLIPFLEKLKEKKVIANMTVAQLHFERNYDFIKNLIDNKLIYGLGISLHEPTNEFINLVKTIPNAVIHVINGIVSMPDLDMMAGENLKILILGYKHLRRGEEYYAKYDELVNGFQNDLKNYLFPEIIRNGWFKVVSFDNLAIEQLDVKSQMPKEQWDEFFMGQDSEFTFYIDMVEGTFGKNSLATERYPIMDSVDDMFEKIRLKR